MIYSSDDGLIVYLYSNPDTLPHFGGGCFRDDVLEQCVWEFCTHSLARQ